MDYDELLEAWRNGNISDVAKEVARMKPSEVMALSQVFQQRGERLDVLERNVARFEN